ncbi:MAG: TIGR03009 domain-containing protein [Gemmataceae bacterium]|nr:TIGR03009 domain-containing protein [Gemmataceae bacterium]
MRIAGISVIGILAVSLVALAQPPAQENLDTVLRGWEKAMTDLKSFVSVVERTTLDKALNARDEHKGYAMFMKPVDKDDGSRARLEMYKVANPKIFEKYICTGTFLYEYVHANSTVRIHNMPQNNKAGMQQESFLSFLFGMGAAEAKQRYHMTHVLANPPDKHYHYILIKPKQDQDKSDFSEARLTLFRSNNLPAQIWYLQPNKNEITWNFKDVQINVQIPINKYFEPDHPKDWRVERVPAKPGVQGQPVIRN